MSDTDGSTPIEQIESASGSTETHPAAPPAARSQKTVIAALVVFIAFLIVFGVYWVQTTEARFERQVTVPCA